MITNWIQKQVEKSNILRVKPKKGSKNQIQERHDIRRKISKIRHQFCYAMITEIINSRIDIKVDEEIRVTCDCILKIT